MAIIRSLTLVLCLLLWSADAIDVRVLSREELAPLLAKKVVIPNQHKPETPKATPWPWEFSISFTTDNDSATGVLLYDWGNRQQVIIHGETASHCVSRGTPGPCYILENGRGTFEVDPLDRKCELTFPDVGSVPPTWVSHGVFVGVEDVKGVKCNRFGFPPTMHAWLETVEGGLPCAFVFPNPNFTYYFDAGTLKLGQPVTNMFRVPEYCPQGTVDEIQGAAFQADQ